MDTPWLELMAQATARGALLLAAAGAATVLLRGASAATRHLVWSLAFLGLLALPVLPRLLPALRVRLPEAARTVLAPPLPAPEAVLPLRVRLGDAATEDPAPAPASFAAEEPAQPAADAPAAEPRGASLSADLSFDVSGILLLLWGAGAARVLGRLLLGVLRVRRMGSRAERVADGPLAALVERLRVEAGVRRRVALLRGGDLAMPVTWGVLRPRVLLPAGAEAWPEGRLRAVLLHELAHVRRGDWLTQVAAEVACALYWFNPLVWAAAHRLRAEGEHACDDHVLRAGSRPSDYAGHLLEVARSLRVPRSGAVAAVAMARPSQLRGRLLAVLSEGRRRGPVSRRFAVPALAGGGAAVLLLAALTPAARAADPVLAVLPAAVAARPVPAPPPSPAAAAPAQGAERCPARGSRSGNDLSINGRWIVSWSNRDGCGGSAEIVGDVAFNADRTDVASVPAGGRLELELYRGGRRERLEVRGTAGGRLERSWTVNGAARPWDAEARRWTSGALAELFRHTSYGSEQRIRTALARGDRDAVLEEVARASSDGDRRSRLEKLLALGGDDARLLPRVVDEAVKIGSDGDKTAVLMAVSARSRDPEVLRRVLAAARDVGSDGDRARLLTAFVARHGVRGAAVREAFFSAADAFGSSGDRRRVLSAVARRGDTDEAALVRLLRSAEGIGSDGDRAAVLAAVAERGGLTPTVREAYLRVAEGIGSDGDRERSLRRVGAAASASASATATGRSTTSLVWTDSDSGRRVALEARDVVLDARGREVAEVRPGGYLEMEETRGSFRQRVRITRGSDGKPLRSYSGSRMEGDRLRAWEAELIARFSSSLERRTS